MIEPERLRRAYETARAELLAERGPHGHWVGRLSSSALSTATATSALAVVLRSEQADSIRVPLLCRNSALGKCDTGAPLLRSSGTPPGQLEELVARGVDYLIRTQNPDGGWGDTDLSRSNIATTMLVQAAIHLAGAAEQHGELLRRAEKYVERQGGVPGLRKRYGRDKTFAVPILTNCALAGLVEWREVAPLAFELACFPHRIYRFLRLPVVSYAIPALVAIGQARYFHCPPRNPLTRLVRRLAVEKSLRVLERMQPPSGGFLEATPLTSFVVMSLASIGRADHPVVQKGVRFLIDSARTDGSWPIDTNLATWVTTLSINALAASGEHLTAGLGGEAGALECLDWLLSCQHWKVHPFTNADPGGWGWSDLDGAVPDADDTAGALLALAAIARSARLPEVKPLQQAARMGLTWLFALQNKDGGWPTFCRGWGKLPFDRSGVDLTAHALRALHAWQPHLPALVDETYKLLLSGQKLSRVIGRRHDRAIRRGLEYLARQQRPDGSWIPLWFGNQDHPNEENPVYGTARVLLAYRDLGLVHCESARRGERWLLGAQNPDGGWGGRLSPESAGSAEPVSSVEETAVALEALIAAPGGPPLLRVENRGTCAAVDRGLAWLVAAVESGRHRQASPIGLYFARLWYYERLYPLVFTVSTLGRAVRRWCPR